MAYLIASTCDACNHCLTVCPIDGAVSPGDIYSIDAELCIDCGICEDGCPSFSIYRPRPLLKGAGPAPEALP
jgi:ferredoxin